MFAVREAHLRLGLISHGSSHDRTFPFGVYLLSVCVGCVTGEGESHERAAAAGDCVLVV